MKKIFIENYIKMYRRPLYRLSLFIFGLPIMLFTFVAYLFQKKSDTYVVIKNTILEELNTSGQTTKLMDEIRLQLKNKINFFNKPLNLENFEKQLKIIYNKRLSELLEIKFKEYSTSHNTAPISRVDFLKFFTHSLENTAFFYLTIILGFPMFLLTLIYSNPYIKYIFERLIMMIFVIFGVTLLVFTILYLSPMDASLNILGSTATKEQVTAFKEVYGLDKPYIIQLLNTFKGLLTFNLGKSYMGNEDVLVSILRKFPITLQLTFYSLFISIAIAIPAGIISAIKPYSAYDYIFMLLALIGLSIPTFWMGLVFILNFSIKNNILPATFSANNFKSFIMPSVVLGTSLAASVARMTRSSMLEVIKQEYIVTAKAKGLSKARVILRHALGNAMIPITTVIGLQFGAMLGGSAVTEKVFNVNGIGSYIVDKQFIPDTPVVLAGVVYVAIVISIINLFVDIIYAFIDPRIKSKMKSY